VREVQRDREVEERWTESERQKETVKVKKWGPRIVVIGRRRPDNPFVIIVKVNCCH
jgi:hypothetical protein